jgi:hypothetical protein
VRPRIQYFESGRLLSARACRKLSHGSQAAARRDAKKYFTASHILW